MRFRIPGNRLWRVARRLRGDRDGSAAVEFALVAPIFFALLFAIIETALVFFAGQLLETATQDSSRLVLTGQVQSPTYTQANFKTAVCQRLSSIFDCNQVFVDVKSYTGFNNIVITEPIDGNKNFVPNMSYSPGNAGDVVVVRVFYQWPLFVTGLGYNIANLAGSKRLLSSIIAFRNEPY